MIESFIDESEKKQEYSFASGYNLPYGEDKRFRKLFIKANDLGSVFWDEIREEYEKNLNKPDKSFEGTLIYVLCEEESEIKRKGD